MQGIDIIPFKKKYLPLFQEYIHTAFHRKYILAEERFLDWQYGRSGKLYLALHDGQIVGHLGHRDFFYKVYDQRQQIRVVMNLFSLERYHRTGVGPLLSRKVFDTP